MLDLERLRVLRAVDGTGSVRGAAASLHVTTSAVSQQLARLERETGQPLVERVGRGIRLTDAGRLLSGHAGRLLAQVEQVETDLERHRDAVAGTLAVAAFATAARGLLPEWLRRCRDRYPRLTVRVSEQEPDQAITALQAGDLDLAVAQDWPDDPLPVPDGLTRRALCDDVLDVALPAEHRLARRAEVTLSELTGEDWVSWPADELCHGWLARTLRKLGNAPRIAHTASEHSTQLALVAGGMGAAVLPRLGREPLPAGARVVALHPTPCRRVFALWRSAGTHRPALRAGLHELAATAKDTGQPT